MGDVLGVGGAVDSGMEGGGQGQLPVLQPKRLPAAAQGQEEGIPLLP